jgi:hypothetical protein
MGLQRDWPQLLEADAAARRRTQPADSGRRPDWRAHGGYRYCRCDNRYLHGAHCGQAFNFCGGGTTSWYSFAREIFAGAERRGTILRAVVQPIPGKDYPTPTPRLTNSVLDCGKIARSAAIPAAPGNRLCRHTSTN